MSIRRRSTVHDLASLRLHPDGFRVQQSRSKTDEVGQTGQGSTAKYPHHKKRRAQRYTANDSRDNWIATDAGGSEVVKKDMRKRKTGLRNVQGGDGSERETINLDVGTNHSAPEGEGSDEEKPVRILKDSRAKRRKAFHESEQYLDDRDIPAQSAIGGQWSPPPPSSVSFAPISYVSVTKRYLQELLKSIHHFACEFYSEQGLLFNAPQVARRERRTRDQTKQDEFNHVMEHGNVESSGSDTEKSSLDRNPDDPYVVENDEDKDESDASARESVENSPVGGSRGKKVKRVRQVGKQSDGVERLKPRRDMYKRFDGSALVAIGEQLHALRLLLRLASELISLYQACFSKSRSCRSR